MGTAPDQGSSVRDQSYGIIPVREVDGEWQIFVIKHIGGHWGFPKGHPEEGEHPNQSAERELTEESGLKVVRYLSGRPLSERYYFRAKGQLISKLVIYFPAEVTGEIKLQLEEVVDGKWVPIVSGHEYLTFSEAQSMCCEVARRLGVE